MRFTRSALAIGTVSVLLLGACGSDSTSESTSAPTSAASAHHGCGRNDHRVRRGDDHGGVGERTGECRRHPPAARSR